MSGDAMAGFLFMKALIARYGTEATADLLALADRLVSNGAFANKREAVAAIETQMDVPVTTPISEEAARYTTRRRSR